MAFDGGMAAFSQMNQMRMRNAYMMRYRGGGHFHRPQQLQQNSTDIYTGRGNHHWNRRGNFWSGRGRGTSGYGLNLNQRAGHQRGQDGILVFDMNKDGKYDKRDVQNSNDMMKAATGNYDFNKDGKTDFFEKLRGRRLGAQYRKMAGRDGVLQTHEMHRAGGKVWIDKSRGGGVGRNELHSVYRVPSRDAYGSRTTQRLDFVDPFAGVSGTTSNRSYFRPSPWGGGYGGGHINRFQPPWMMGGHHGRFW